MEFTKYLLASIIVFSGCGGKDDSGSSDPAPQRTNLTPEEAVSQLPDELKKSFEDWKSKLVKSCEEFVTKDDVKNTGVAIDQLLKLTNNSAFIGDQEGNFLVLDSGEHYSGHSESHNGYEENINGASYRIESNRKNSECEIKINNTVVYKTTIAPHVKVATFGKSNMVKVNYKTTDYDLVKRGDLLATSLNSYHLGNLNSIINSTNKSDLNEVAVKLFGITTDQAQLYFKSVDSSNLTHTITAIDTDTAKFTQNSASIYNDVSGIQKLLAKNELTVKYDFDGNSFAYDNVKASEDVPVIQVEYQLKNFSIIEGSPSQIKFDIVGVNFVGKKSYDINEAAKCMLDTKNKVIDSEFFPAFSTISFPCETYYKNSLEVLIKSDIGQKLNPWKYYHEVGSEEKNYLGWDSVLRSIFAMLSKDKTVFDHYFKDYKNIPVLEMMKKENQRYEKMIGDFPKMRELYPEFLEDVILHWPMINEEVSDEFLQLAFEAGENTIDFFPSSSKIMLLSLTRDHLDEQKKLEFATTLSKENKEELSQIKDSASLLEITSVLKDKYFDDYLQRNTNNDIITKLKNAISELSKFKSEDGETKDKDKFEGFAIKVLDELWSKSEYLQIKKIVELYQYETSFSCEEAQSVVEKWSCLAYKNEIFSKQENKYLHPSYKERYSNFATNIVQNFPKDDSYLRFQLKEIFDSFFDGLWISCNNEKFASNSKEIWDLVAKFKNTEGLDSLETSRIIRDLVNKTCD